MTRQVLLVDACVAINICSTDELPQIASRLSITFLMVDQAAGEVRELRELIDNEVVVKAIDLQSYGQGNLQLTSLLESEYPAFVELAKQIDDGEAATIVVARARNMSLATDDRKARRISKELGLPEAVHTLSLLHQYSQAAELDRVRIREMLVKVHRRASYQPRQSDPHFEWWHSYIDLPDDA